jgi:hypothetical protein
MPVQPQQRASQIYAKTVLNGLLANSPVETASTCKYAAIKFKLRAICNDKSAEDIRKLLIEKAPSIPSQKFSECPVTLGPLDSGNILLYVTGNKLRHISIDAYNKLKSLGGDPNHRECPLTRLPIIRAVCLRELVCDGGLWHPWSEHKKKHNDELKTDVEKFQAAREYGTNDSFWAQLVQHNPNLLSDWLTDQPEIAKVISPDMLAQRITHSEDDTTIFNILITHNEGILFLDKLFHLNPALAGCITAEILKKKPLSTPGSQDVSIFFLLISTKRVQPAIYRHFTDNPELARSITPDMLKQSLSIGPGQGLNTFFFMCLKNKELAHQIFTTNPELARSITPDMLKQSLAIGPGAGLSTLFFMCFKSNHSLALSIFTANPELARSITLDMLKQSPTTGSSQGLGSFFFMCARNQKLALCIFTANPELARSITPDILKQSPSTGSSQGLSIFFLMCFKNQELAHQIFTANPELARSITPDMLKQSPTAGPNQGLTTFFFMCLKDQKIAHQIFTANPELARSITPDMLKQSGYSTLQSRDVSPLITLEESTLGLRVLMLLNKQQPKLTAFIQPILDKHPRQCRYIKIKTLRASDRGHAVNTARIMNGSKLQGAKNKRPRLTTDLRQLFRC